MSPSAISGTGILSDNTRGNANVFQEEEYKMISEKIEISLRNKQESNILT